MRPEDLVAVGEWLGGQTWLALDEFALACGVDRAFVVTLVEEELVVPVRSTPEWRFGGAELGRVRRILRLQRDFDASLQSVAVIMDLLDEVERLRGALGRAGLSV